MVRHEQRIMKREVLDEAPEDRKVLFVRRRDPYRPVVHQSTEDGVRGRLEAPRCGVLPGRSRLLEGDPKGAPARRRSRVTEIGLLFVPMPAFRAEEGRTRSRVRGALDGVRTVDFDYDAAEETAAIRGALLDRGRPLGTPDVLIAGITRPIRRGTSRYDQR